MGTGPGSPPDRGNYDRLVRDVEGVLSKLDAGSGDLEREQAWAERAAETGTFDEVEALCQRMLWSAFFLHRNLWYESPQFVRARIEMPNRGCHFPSPGRCALLRT